MSNSTIRWTPFERDTIANEVVVKCLDGRKPLTALSHNNFTRDLIVSSQGDIAEDRRRMDPLALGTGTIGSIIAAAIRLVTDHPEDYDMGERSEPTVLESSSPIKEEIVEEVLTIDSIGVDKFMELMTDAATHPVYSPLLKKLILEVLGTSVMHPGAIIVSEAAVGSNMLSLANKELAAPAKPIKPIRGSMTVPKVPVLVLGLLPNQNESHTRHIDPKIKGNVDITFLGANIKLTQLKGYEIVIIAADNASHPAFSKMKEKVQSLKKVCRITTLDPHDIADDMESAYDQYRFNKNKGIK